MTTYETLVRARAEVEKGWCRKALVDTYGNVCMRGAIDTALGAPRSYRTFAFHATDDHPAVAAVQAMLDKHGYHWSIEGFNDYPGRTKADVLGMLELTANALVPVGDPAHDFATVA